MALQPISPPVGVFLSGSPYSGGKDVGYTGSGTGFRQGQGRWTTASNIEFLAGFPQKIAGWVAASASKTVGIPRAFRQWLADAATATIFTGVGTDSHLYYLDDAGNLTDITPKQTNSTALTDAITTHSNSTTVDIADATGSIFEIGDLVGLFATTAVSNVLLNGWYVVSAATPGVGYSITYSALAIASAGPGGGAIVAHYPRLTQVDPFTTTLGSPTVSVLHGSAAPVVGTDQVGQYVTISDATAVGGLTISGQYRINSIIDSTHYTITAASNATSGATGGGNATFVYDVNQVGSLTPLGLNGWTLDAYGNQLLAGSIGGTIYVYDPAFPATRAYPLKNAPTTIMAMFVTPERFVVALGINGNLLQIAWPDQSDYTDWTTTPTNTANSGRTLVGGSYFVGGKAVRDGVSLIWTDRCVFEMNYLGSFEIYSTQLAGDNCGLVSPNAACVEGGIAYWMGDADFWTWNGSSTLLPSDDVRTAIFNPGTPYSFNPAILSKCVATLNRTKHQVRFYYPFVSNSENTLGVIYQYDNPCFSTLAYGRSGAYDAELASSPVSGDTFGTIYFDEMGTDANGVAIPWALALSELEAGNGDHNVDILGFVPDYTGDAVNLLVSTRDYPGTPVMLGSVIALSPLIGRVDLRLDGRIFYFLLSAAQLGEGFRLGVPRLDVQPAGMRL